MNGHAIMSSQKGSPPQRDSKDRDPQSAKHAQRPGDSKKPESMTPPDFEKPSGRPTFDSRGNAVWEWQTEEAGKFSTDVSTQRLKKLEASELTLEDTRRLKKLAGAKPYEKVGGGFNPYDRGVDRNGNPTANSSASSQDAPPARKPIKDLKRYDEWVKMKQRMADKKDDE